MSTHPSVPQSSPPAQREPAGFFGVRWKLAKPGELVVFHHSNLFYWWPVWLLGFILAGVTWTEHGYLAVVPEGTKADRQVAVYGNKDDLRDVLVLPEHVRLKVQRIVEGEDDFDPYVRISRHKGLGTLFVAVLLVVIMITNIAMRGLWSVFVIMMLVMLSIIFWLADWWQPILNNVRLLSIHINFSGYLLISGVLWTAWMINFFLFDRQTYMIFSPGQVRARLTIGGGETVYGTQGMAVQKQRGDLFRHWILGFGSGDLIVRPAGQQHPIEMPNVMNVGSIVKQIERMVKEQVVVSGNK